MKKVSVKGKLGLNKEIIAKLNNDQLNDVKGGRPKVSVNTVDCQTQYCVYTLYYQDSCGSCSITNE
jgi:hypothetical protein